MPPARTPTGRTPTRRASRAADGGTAELGAERATTGQCCAVAAGG
jgi:hypothetical protein